MRVSPAALILTGVGSFTIVDEAKVSFVDIGNNFFLDSTALGESRGNTARQLLLELNEDVNGDWEDQSPETLLQNNPEFFLQFDVVICTDLCERTLIDLSEVLWKGRVPLVVVRSYGLLGSLRLAVFEHTVIDSHPDTAVDDLRLDRPFSSLIDFCESQKLESMNKTDLTHTPWLVILYHSLQHWKSEHNGDPPKSVTDKKQLKESITRARFFDQDSCKNISVQNEENFVEAVKKVNTSLQPSRIPSSIQSLFGDSQISNFKSPFWIMIHALKDYCENEGHGLLPLRGTLPDMHADSKRFIALQTLYRQQAESEAKQVFLRVQKLLAAGGQPLDSISAETCRAFCKNAAFLRVIRCRSIAAEYAPQADPIEEIASCIEQQDLEGGEFHNACFYVLLRAVDRFRTKHGNFPVVISGETDIPAMKACVQEILAELKMPNTSIRDDLIFEVCRWGGVEMHSIAAMIGGVAAQEVIKLITRQFVPAHDFFIYNAILQTTDTLKL